MKALDEGVGGPEVNNDILTRTAEAMLSRAGLGPRYLAPAHRHAQFLLNLRPLRDKDVEDGAREPPPCQLEEEIPSPSTTSQTLGADFPPCLRPASRQPPAPLPPPPSSKTLTLRARVDVRCFLSGRGQWFKATVKAA